jgi:predicted transcriptional regulator
MNATFTIRLGEEQRRQLRELASKLGKSDSELVRQMIERGLAEEPVGRRIAHLKGALAKSPPRNDSLSHAIRQRNWRS